MEAFHDAGVRTTCFISPIFPGITDVAAIIRRVRDHCNLVWLENLNLRGSYKADIFRYVSERHPELMPTYKAIYLHNDRSYWSALDEETRAFAAEEGLPYVRDNDSMRRPFDAPPVIVNHFFHGQLVPSTKRKVCQARTA